MRKKWPLARSFSVKEGRHLAQEHIHLVDESHMPAACQYDHFGSPECRVSLLRSGPADEIMIAQNDQRRYRAFQRRPGVGAVGFENNFIVTDTGAEVLDKTPMLFW
jgi:hypothetical protein